MQKVRALYPGRRQKLILVYSGPRPILHPSLVEICSLPFVWSCSQTNKESDADANITSLVAVIIIIIIIQQTIPAQLSVNRGTNVQIKAGKLQHLPQKSVYGGAVRLMTHFYISPSWSYDWWPPNISVILWLSSLMQQTDSKEGLLGVVSTPE